MHGTTNGTKPPVVKPPAGHRIDDGLAWTGKRVGENRAFRRFNTLTDGPQRKLIVGSAATAAAATGVAMIAGRTTNPIDGARDAAGWVADHRDQISMVAGTVVTLALLPKIPSVRLLLRAQVKTASAKAATARALERTALNKSQRSIERSIALDKRVEALRARAAVSPAVATSGFTGWRMALAGRPIGKVLTELGKPAAAIGTANAAWSTLVAADQVRGGDTDFGTLASLSLNGLGALTGAAYLKSLAAAHVSAKSVAPWAAQLDRAENVATEIDDVPLLNLVKEAKATPDWGSAQTKAASAKQRAEELVNQVSDDAKAPVAAAAASLRNAESSAFAAGTAASKSSKWGEMTDLMWHSGVFASSLNNVAVSTGSLWDGNGLRARDAYTAGDLVAKTFLSLHGRGVPVTSAPAAVAQ